VFSADPRIVPNAEPIPSLSYSEVRELALYGAKVLHPATIAPAISAGIPVRVLNTFRHEDAGTSITAENLPHSEIHAVSIVKNCVLVRGTADVVERCFAPEHVHNTIILESKSLEHLSVIAHTPTQASRTNVDVAIAGTHLQPIDCAVVIATGPGASQPATISRLLYAVADHNIYAVINGTSDVSVFFVCDADAVNEVLLKLHAQR